MLRFQYAWLLLLVISESLVLAGDRRYYRAGEFGEPKSEKLDNAVLMAFLQQRAQNIDLTQIDKLIAQLGDNEFEKREAATNSLLTAGGKAIPALKVALKSDDREVVRRAEICLTYLEKQEADFQDIKPFEVLQTVVKRQPEGTIRLLLSYITVADDIEVEIIYFGLDAIFEKEKTLDAKVLPLLNDKSVVRRSLGGFLVGKFGDEEQRKSARALLQDDDPHVRLRTAQGLLAGKDKSGISTLIQLLTNTPCDIAWQAEELLHYVAGATCPKTVVGKGEEQERMLCKEAWEKWWRGEGEQVDMKAVEKSGRQPRLVLVEEEEFSGSMHEFKPLKYAEKRVVTNTGFRSQLGFVRWNGYIWLCGCDGKPRCQPISSSEFRDRERNRACIIKLMKARGIRLVTSQFEEITFQHNDHLLPHRLQIRTLRPPWVEGLHRVIEVNERGQRVWEVSFEMSVCGLELTPLVRAGFNRKSTEPVVYDKETLQIGLSSEDPTERCLAIQEIAVMDLNRDLFELVVKALDDRDPRVRIIALRILRQQTDIDPFVRTPDIQPVEGRGPRVTLGFTIPKIEPRSEIGPRASEAIPNLIRCLEDTVEDVRDEAKWTLLGCGDKAVNPVTKAYQDATTQGKLQLRRDTIIVLIDAEFRSNPGKEIEDILRNALRDSEPRIRSIVTHVLLYTLFDHPGAAPVIKKYLPEFLNALNDSDKNVVRVAEDSFCWLKDLGSPGIPHFLRCLSDPDKMYNAIRTLSYIGKNNRKVTAALLKIVEREPSVAICSVVADALGECGAGSEAVRIVPVLEKMLSDQRLGSSTRQPDVQIDAAGALGRIGKQAESTVPALRKLAGETSFSKVKEEAEKAINSILNQERK